MKSLKNNEEGFGFFEWLLILLIILILAFVGWFVYKSKKNTEKSQQNAANAQSEPAKAEKKPASKPAAIKYLEIKELGVKVELNDTTNDAYYVMKNGYAYISTTSLKNANAECAADKTGVVAVSKALKTDNDEMLGMTYEQHIQGGGSGTIIGNNAYLMNRSQAYCSDDPAVQQKQQAAWDAFLAKAKTMQAL